MEVKKNLNNVQRKMLDAIYTEEFDKRAQAIREDRSKGLADVQTKVVKELLNNKDIKKMVEAGMVFYRMAEKLQGKLDGQGVCVENRLTREPFLKFGSRYYGSGHGEAKEVVAYNAETRRIELVLADKKKEMRAKIYGVAASYEEVDSEIKELLKDV